MNLTQTWLGTNIPYAEALQTQETQLQKILNNTAPDTYYTLEHAPIYTIGRTRDKTSLLDPQHLPHPHIETNRGGQATYHGPGQLVGYPIIDLRPLGKDLHTYIRAIEQALIQTCQDFGVKATRREGLTGVWINDRKLAAIGVGVRKWITMHGYAINITPESLSGFNHITPCGIQNVKTTTLTHEAKTPITTTEFANATTKHLNQTLTNLTI